jgi:hypothetical protein
LLAYALTHDVLQEKCLYPALKCAGTLAVSVIALWSLALLFLPLTAARTGEFREAMQVWAGLTAMSVPVAALFSLLTAASVARHRLMVSVAAGKLTVTGRGASQVIPLAQCEWYIGSISETNMLDYSERNSHRDISFLQAPALIISSRPADETDGQRVAVGVTHEMRELWEAFLGLAWVPERANKRTARRRSVVLQIGSFGLFFGLMFTAGMMIGRAASNSLAMFVDDQDICETVGYVVFVDAFFTAIFYGMICGPWSFLDPAGRSRESRTSDQWIPILMCLAATALFVLPLTFDAEISVVARVVGIVLGCTWAIAVGIDLRRRVSQRDRKQTNTVE